MVESSRRYNLRDTRKKPQGMLLKQWEVEYSNLISNENRHIPLEKVKTAICSAYEDGMFEQWRITLKCPLSGQRIKVPARYGDCTHIECFDLEAFLQMKTQKNLRVCPICQKEIEKPLANLQIDKYIKTVLSTLPDAMHVELLPDGSFIEVYEQFVVMPNVINDEEPYVQDTNAPAFGIKHETTDGDECITLSDGEGESMDEIVEMKPICLMPLNLDIKPNIAASSEPEQINSGENLEIQDEQNSASHKKNQSLKERIHLGKSGSSVGEPKKRVHGVRKETHRWINKNKVQANFQQKDRSQRKKKSRINRHEVGAKRTVGEKKRLQCKMCHYATKYNNSLTKHMRRHTGERPFKCELCNYAAAQLRTLIEHERIHTGEKPFKCKYCNYASAYNSNLFHHIRIHTGEKPYRCGFCQFASSSNGSLKRHMRTQRHNAIMKLHTASSKKDAERNILEKPGMTEITTTQNLLLN